MERLKCNIDFVYGIGLLMMSVINILMWCLGYCFLPFSYILMLIFFAVVCVMVAVTSVKYRNQKTRLSTVFAFCMPLIALIFVVSVCLSLELNTSYISWNMIYMEVIFLISMVTALIIFTAVIKHKQLRIVFIVLTSAGGAFLLYVMSIIAVFSSFGYTEVTHTLNSPDEKYSAMVITSDEGALGGSATKVSVRKLDDVSVLFGTLKKSDKTIEFGDWGTEYDISWKDSETLTVNDKDYNVPYAVSIKYKNKDSLRLGVYIPDRKPDFYEDTHGGFHGDGKYVAIYRLTEEEKKLIETDVQLNENWKRIDEKSSKYLYGGAPGIYSEGYTLREIPVIDDGYYITYDKKTWQSTLALSGNYIICEYSIKDNTLYIFELDT